MNVIQNTKKCLKSHLDVSDETFSVTQKKRKSSETFFEIDISRYHDIVISFLQDPNSSVLSIVHTKIPTSSI